jgi:CDP-diacylglycerol---serine O-phosphatidyltransferase
VAVRRIAIVPTLLTLGNGVCGFAAIANASKIGTIDVGTGIDPFFAASGWLIVAAMVFDMLDGYVARLSKSASKFGGELDSLCDVVSFGVAPAFLLLRLGPGWQPQPVFHQALAGIASLYLVCALLRLARFNVENTPDPASHKRFRGLPSPAAAGCIASLAILRGELPAKLALRVQDFDADLIRRWIEVWAPIGAFVVALLMVSRVPYPHVTKQMLRGRRHFGHLVQVILIGFTILLAREVALLLLFWGYALILALRYGILQSLRHKPLPTPNLDEGLPH